jgi:hypothetical protein
MVDLTGCRVREIDVADAGDRRLTLELINRLYPHIPWSEAHFDWQFRQGPSGPARVRVIEADGRMVATYVATRKTLSLEGQERPAWMVQDVMTDPAFRGRGFLNHLAMLFMADMAADGTCGYTFPNKQSENSFRRSGWTELMRVPVRIAAARPTAAVREPKPVISFKTETAGIWREAGFRIGVFCDRAYLNWRYGRPETVYSQFMIGDDDGVLVIKQFNDGQRRVVHICELFVRARSRSTLLGSALAFVHSFAVSNGAEILTCWLPDGHSDLAQYERAGFARDPGNDRFVFVHGPRKAMILVAHADDEVLGAGGLIQKRPRSRKRTRLDERLVRRSVLDPLAFARGQKRPRDPRLRGDRRGAGITAYPAPLKNTGDDACALPSPKGRGWIARRVSEARAG